MSNEIGLASTLSYTDASGKTDSLALPVPTNDSPSTLTFCRQSQVVTNSSAALNLGALGSLGWFMAINRDGTNYVNLLTGTGGVVMCKIGPGKCCGPLYFGSGVTAPYVVAGAGSPILDYMITSQ